MAATEQHVHSDHVHPDHVHTDECAPTPARWGGVFPSWTPPVVVGLLGIGACVLLNVRDPNVSGSYGLCPSQALFGIDCPGCGLMRGTYALTEGDVAGALDHNLFILPVLGVFVYAYLRWAGEYFGYSLPRLAPKAWLVISMAAVIVAFWVLRNVGGPFEFLASNAT
jgi:hypothetical protein